ncbi:disintegrin and metalloproteinase domain-containing protein 12-like [Anthonomus grandis grandis]|uniref:disintegrin and metalloproteinase domain-containing protein 12-like n=1 Tax=Anthonomus grandis grandis TaxID=2921223 RepID=UPI0021653649|nr:disintegrin and metalloproteinase domain-containing protein 12-like [Anthonomus grandis grandis]
MLKFIFVCALLIGNIVSLNIDKNEINLRSRQIEDQNQSITIIPGNTNISKFIELALVVDKTKHEALGSNEEITILFCQNITNILNSIYEPLNISIALVQVVIWSEKDEIEISSNGDTTLNKFLKYRAAVLNLKYPNDNAQLISGKSLENGVVAKALKGPICTHEYSGGINMGNFSSLPRIATIIAHSIGHNIGMEHDTEDCNCPDDLCIMTTNIPPSFIPTSWSSCSKNYTIKAFKHGMDYCLQNKPEKLFKGPVCGNGFIEPGEECDCGSEEYCNNNCCNATSCKLKENAVCAGGECCDIKLCQLKPGTPLCRPAKTKCDLPEFCTTESAYCPEDKYRTDTELCGNGDAFCFEGLCTSRHDQCKLLWGDTGANAIERCYSALNTKGNIFGHCGYDVLSNTFTKCEEKDVSCGLLHCTHQNDRLEFGFEATSKIRHNFLQYNGSIHGCRSVIVSLGNQRIDPGLTPNGAKCGENMMCLNQKCRSISDIHNEM